MDYVKIRSPGWGLSDIEHEELSITPSTADVKSLTPLRPGDVFHIASTTLSVEVRQTDDLATRAEIQVTSSGHNNGITQNIIDLENRPAKEFLDRDTDPDNLQSIAGRTSNRLSTPIIPSSRPLAVLETPTIVRTRQQDPGPVAIMSSVDGNAMEDLPDAGAVSAGAFEQPIVEHDDIGKDSRDNTRQRITRLPDTIDRQPSSTTDEDSLYSSQTPPSGALRRDADPNQDSMKSTILVEIPMMRKSSSETARSAKARKAKQAARGSAEPSSSSRSTRSNPGEDSSAFSLPHSDVRVMFASSTLSDKSPQFAKFLKKQGVKTVKSVAECTVLCVGRGAELKKTSNLILAVASGKEIITDDWISQSATKGEVLDPEGFLASDPKREEQWGITLSDAIERGRQGVKPLLGYTIHFTLSVKQELGKGFTDLKEIAVFAGAECIKTVVPRKSSDKSPMTMVIAADDDKDLPLLEEKSWKSYSKEIITLSVLRGHLDLDSDEFRVSSQAVKQSGIGKKRKR